MSSLARSLSCYKKTAAIFSIAVLTAFLLHSTPLHARETTSSHHQNIRIPLGLAWGDPTQNLENMAKPGGFAIINKEERGDKTTITVHGLIGTALQETLFIYHKNELVEIEYHYGNRTWKPQNYQDFFDSFRRMYDGKYGAGNPLLQPASKKNDPPGITTALTGYEWNQAGCNLDLFYFIAEGSNQAYRLISLHYKAP
jgi:hypothetical protein